MEEGILIYLAKATVGLVSTVKSTTSRILDKPFSSFVVFYFYVTTK